MAKYNIKTLKEKEAIWRCYEKHGWQAVAEKYGISRLTFLHWKQRIEEDGGKSAHPLARRPKTRTIRPETVAYVKELYEKHPTASITQLRNMACKKQSISRTTVWHILRD